MSYRYTSKKNSDGSTSVYAIVLFWPENNVLTVGATTSTSSTTVNMLGYKGEAFKWAAHSGGGMDITFPAIPTNQMPCEWAWVLKIDDLSGMKSSDIKTDKSASKTRKCPNEEKQTVSIH